MLAMLELLTRYHYVTDEETAAAVARTQAGEEADEVSAAASLVDRAIGTVPWMGFALPTPPATATTAAAASCERWSRPYRGRQRVVKIPLPTAHRRCLLLRRMVLYGEKMAA